MKPPTGSILIDTAGWRGRVVLDMARYHALGREQQEASEQADAKYATRRTREEYEAERRRLSQRKERS